MALYLGLDCSTQSLTAIVIEIADGRRDIVFQDRVIFDRDLPAYGTSHGVLPSRDPRVATSSPLMWAEALDVLLGRIAGSTIAVADIAAIAGSAQQHGSVYLTVEAAPRLAALDPARPIRDQLDGVWSRPDAPIWMDSSTAEECREITEAIGGATKLAALTGSRAFERFTGPQIRRFARTRPEAFAATHRVHLVGSFMASLLLGRHAAVDPGDGSGTNLMNLSTAEWSAAALAATAPDLARRLPPIVPSHSVIGTLSPYWQTRHGLPGAAVVVWSGDNPCSLIGTGMTREGPIAISLGTSDTVFGLMVEPRVDVTGTGHVFGAPTGDFMGLTCFRNGSLAREAVRLAHDMDWDAFSEAIEATPPGNRGALMVPWFEPEITPFVREPGPVQRLNLDPADGAADVRAVVEAQMMAMERHSSWMGVDVAAIHATGGASANPAILQVMADVFGAVVHRCPVTDSACLGAALRAFHADLSARGQRSDWDEVVRGFAEPAAASPITPRREYAETYAALKRDYCEFESRVLAEHAP